MYAACFDPDVADEGEEGSEADGEEECDWDEQAPPEIVEPPVGVPRSSIFGRGQKFEGQGDFRGYYGHGNSEGYYDSDGCFTRVDPGLPKPQSVSKETLKMLSGRKRRLEKEDARVAKRSSAAAVPSLFHLAARALPHASPLFGEAVLLDEINAARDGLPPVRAAIEEDVFVDQLCVQAAEQQPPPRQEPPSLSASRPSLMSALGATPTPQEYRPPPPHSAAPPPPRRPSSLSADERAAIDDTHVEVRHSITDAMAGELVGPDGQRLNEARILYGVAISLAPRAFDRSPRTLQISGRHGDVVQAITWMSSRGVRIPKPTPPQVPKRPSTSASAAVAASSSAPAFPRTHTVLPSKHSERVFSPFVAAAAPSGLPPPQAAAAPSAADAQSTATVLSRAPKPKAPPAQAKKSHHQGSKHTRGQRVKWSYSEERALREGFAAHGPKWALILETAAPGAFNKKRTNVDLQNKAKNLNLT